MYSPTLLSLSFSFSLGSLTVIETPSWCFLSLSHYIAPSLLLSLFSPLDMVLLLLLSLSPVSFPLSALTSLECFSRERALKWGEEDGEGVGAKR